MKNKLISIFIAITIIFSYITTLDVLADENAVNIYIEDTKVEFGDNKPVNIDGVIYVPIMDFMKDRDNFDIVYDADKQIIAISGTMAKVSFQINNKTVGSYHRTEKEGHQAEWSFTDPNYPRLINNVPYVSIRAFAKAIGWGVRWDNDKKAVVLINSRISYVDGKVFKTFAGRKRQDNEERFTYSYEGNFNDIVFGSLSFGISSTEDGTIYLDKGKGIIKMNGGKAKLFPLEVSPNKIKCRDGNIYFKALGENNLYKFDGKNVTSIIDECGGYGDDYEVDSKGNVYITCKYDDGTYLCKIDTYTGNKEQVQRLEEYKNCFNMAVDNYDNLYICSEGTYTEGNTGENVIYYYNFTDKTFKICAGLKGQKTWYDSNNAEDICFYSPSNIKYSNGYLYVYDSGYLRRVAVDKGIATKAETIAGGGDNEFSPNITAPAKDFKLDFRFHDKDFTVVGDKIYFPYFFEGDHFVGIIE